MQPFTEFCTLTKAITSASNDFFINQTRLTCDICKELVSFNCKDKVVASLAAVRSDIPIEVTERKDLNLLDLIQFFEKKIEFSTLIDELFTAHKDHCQKNGKPCTMLSIIAGRYTNELYREESIEENRSWVLKAYKLDLINQQFFRNNRLYDILREAGVENLERIMLEDEIESVCKTKAKSPEEVITKMIPEQLTKLLELMSCPQKQVTVYICGSGYTPVNHAKLNACLKDRDIQLYLGMPMSYFRYSSWESYYEGNGMCLKSEHELKHNVAKVYAAVKKVAPKVKLLAWTLEANDEMRTCSCMVKQHDMAIAAIRGELYVPPELRPVPVRLGKRRASSGDVSDIPMKRN